MPLSGSSFSMFMILVLFELCLSGGLAQGEEPIPIQEVLENPEEFHLANVFFKGTAQQVQAIDPYTISSGDACYGAYSFSLEDGSGGIQIFVLGFCGTPVLRPPPFTGGEKLLVHAHIHAPGHSGYFKDMQGIPVPDWPPTTVQAIASQIQLVTEE